MEVDLTNVATSEAEPEAVVAGTPDEVEPDPELEGEGLFPPHLARWIWLAGALAQLRRVEARMQQMVMGMPRDAWPAPSWLMRSSVVARTGAAARGGAVGGVGCPGGRGLSEGLLSAGAASVAGLGRAIVWRWFVLRGDDGCGASEPATMRLGPELEHGQM